MPAQVLGGVDLDRVAGGHRLHRDPAEEAVAALAQALRTHDVERAGFTEVGLAVLAARAHGRVVVHPVAGAGPDELVGLGAGEDRVGLAVQHLRDGRVEVAGVEERARALDEHDDLGLLAGQLRQGVQHGGLAGGGRTAEIGGPAHDPGARGLGHLGDPVVVGADDHLVHQFGAQTGVHRPGDERDAAHLLQVLQGDAHGASTGGDDGQHSHE